MPPPAPHRHHTRRWAAQDPCNAASDAKDPAFIDEWARKVMRHGEMDLWFYLPDTSAGA